MLHDLTGPGGLDFVDLLDPAGKVICRSGGKRTGDDLSADPLVAGALVRAEDRERDRRSFPPAALDRGSGACPTGLDPGHPHGNRAAHQRHRSHRRDGGGRGGARAQCPGTGASRALRRRSAQPTLRDRRRDQAAGIPRRSVPGQTDRRGDHLPGGPSHFHHFPDGRRRPGGGDPVEHARLRGGAGPRRRLVRPGVRGQRLVPHCERADPGPGRPDHWGAGRGPVAGAVLPSVQRDQRRGLDARDRSDPGQPGAAWC